MEAAKSSETLVPYCVTTRCHNSEDRDLNLHRREDLKIRIKYFPVWPRIPGQEINTPQSFYPHMKIQPREMLTYIHVLSGTRYRDLGVRGLEDCKSFRTLDKIMFYK